jgi:hypothetical protein
MPNFTDIPKIGDIVETIFPRHYYISKVPLLRNLICCPFCGGKPDSKYNTLLNLECEANWQIEDETHVKIIHICNIVHNGCFSAFVTPVGTKASCASKCCAFCGALGSSLRKPCGCYYGWYDDHRVSLEIPCPEILKGKIWTPNSLSSPATIADTAIKAYKSIKDIPKCTCKDVVNFGCKCGAMAAERKLLKNIK